MTIIHSLTITKRRTDLAGRECRAVFSPCEQYRYVLDWITDPGKPLLTVLMLNPSTADHEQTDPTVDGMLRRTHRWGYGGLRVLNLFAYRATEPEDMKKQSDPVGPHNDQLPELLPQFIIPPCIILFPFLMALLLVAFS